MSEYESLNDELSEFERNLKSLRPASFQISEADLMFRAGQEAARSESRRQLRRWQLSTVATSLCALLSASTVWFSDASQPLTPTIVEQSPTGSPSATSAKTVNEATVNVESETPNLTVQNDDRGEQTPHIDTAESKPDMPVTSSPPAIGWLRSLVSVSTPAPDSYLGLRNRVIEQGPSALPRNEGGGGSSADREPLTASPQRARQWFDEGFPTEI